MRKVTIWVAALFFLLISIQPVLADEVSDLKTQVQQLTGRIETLEQEKADKKEVQEMGNKLGTLGDATGTGFIGSDSVGKINVGGFLQTTYTVEEASDQADDFDIKRARVIIAGEPIENWGFKAHFEMDDDGKNPARDLFVWYDGFPGGLKISVGQWLTPLVYEWSRGSVKLDTIIRANMFEGSKAIYKDRHIGVRIDGNLLKKRLKYTLAIVNGTQKNKSDDNSKKDVIIRADITPFKASDKDWGKWLEGLVLGGGIQFGEQPSTSAEDLTEGMRARYVGTLRYKLDKFNFTGEYFYQSEERVGSLEDLEKAGWYMTATYDVTKKLRAVGRYELFDPNKSVDDNKETITTIGAQYTWNKNARLDLNYRDIAEEDADVSNNELIAQLQFKF